MCWSITEQEAVVAVEILQPDLSWLRLIVGTSGSVLAPEAVSQQSQNIAFLLD